MILEQKLIEKQKNKKNIIKEDEDEDEEKKKNQSCMDSWKENKENNTRYKKPKYKSHNYNNHSNKFFHHNKKYFKDYKNYKYPYNSQSNRNNYNINNVGGKRNYIEKEIELNTKEESDIKNSDPIEENSDSNSKNLDFNSQDNTEEINSFEYLNLGLMKSQSEELSHKNIFNYHDIGIKLFPGAFKYNNKNNSYEQNKYINNFNENINNIYEEENKKVSDLYIIKRKNDLECDNYLCKANSSNIKSNQKNGLALAFDYYASFLEDKIK